MSDVPAVDVGPLRTQRAGIVINFRGCVPNPENPEELTDEVVDVDLVVPPLNFDSLQRLQDRLKNLTTSGLSVESMSTLVEAVGQGLRRNYKSVPKWLITQTIDPANMPEMVVALMDVSGLKRKEIEAEKKAMAAQGQPAGTTSTPI